jgi:arylsulfatase A-like enzyme
MERPNIILITTDQQNPRLVGHAGDPVINTPNLDRLAAEGTRFDSAYTPHPYCTPARTSILTGQYAHNHGVPYNINIREDKPDPPGREGLDAGKTAFPEILATAGYQTSLFGKLHAQQQGCKNFGLQLTRLAEGKGQFVLHGNGPDDYRTHLRTEGYPDSTWRTWEDPEYAHHGCVASPLPEKDYIDVWTATQAVNYLEHAEGPFFSWISFSGPHTPFDPPEPWFSMYDPETVPFPNRREGELEDKHPAWVDQIARTIPAIPAGSTDPTRPGGLSAAYTRFSDTMIRRMRAAWYGQISLIDAQIGRVLEVLERRGILDNTLLVFTSDHGDYLGDNWGYYKLGAQYDSLSRLPFIVRWPDANVPTDSVRKDLVCLTDLAPTFLAAAGLDPVEKPDGINLMPVLLNDQVETREGLFLDTTDTVKALVTKDWKCLLWHDGFVELYDRQQDPFEVHNLAAAHQPPAALGALKYRLETWPGT